MFIKKKFIKEFGKVTPDVDETVNTLERAQELIRQTKEVEGKKNFIKRIKFENIEFPMPIDKLRLIECIIINCKFVFTPDETLVFHKCMLENVIIYPEALKNLWINESNIKNVEIAYGDLDDIFISHTRCWKVSIKSNTSQSLRLFKIKALEVAIFDNMNINVLSINNFEEIDETQFYDNEYKSFFCVGNWFLKRKFEDRAYLHSYKKNFPKKAFLWKLLGGKYGGSLMWFLIWPILICGIFGIIYTIFPEMYGLCRWSSNYQPYYFSVVTFFTLGSGVIRPEANSGQICVVIEVIFGYVFLGGLVSIFANKMISKS